MSYLVEADQTGPIEGDEPVVTPPPPSGPSWFADENNALQAAGALNAALGNPGPPGGEMPPTSKDAKAGRVP